LAHDAWIDKGEFMKKHLAVALAIQMIGLTGCATTPNQTRTPYQNQPVYAPSQPSAQAEANKKIIKDGLLGAATGAIAAEVSGGKAGTGALVGAGTNIIGGALFDVLTTPQAQAQPQPVQYAPYVDQWNQQNPGTNRIVRKFDSNGNVISEEVYTR